MASALHFSDKLDLMVTGGGHVGVLLNNGGGTFVAVSRYALGSSFEVMAGPKTSIKTAGSIWPSPILNECGFFETTFYPRERRP